jgi:hypothetical protein
MKDEFEKYLRKQIAELRPVTSTDVEYYSKYKQIIVHETSDSFIEVSISQSDLKNGSPKIGDMIARNPANHLDQWLVAKEYFNHNFEEA